MSTFQLKHQIEYILSISKRDKDSAIISTVECRFCITFGREEGSGSKRKETTNTKFFDYPFYPHQYKTHLNTQHAESWSAYQKLANAEKQNYFSVTPFAATLQSHYVSDCGELSFRIDKAIVDIIIGEMLLLEDHDDDAPITFNTRSLAYFQKLFAGMQEPSPVYGVLVKRPTQFNMTFKYVSQGLSFRQTVNTMIIAKELLGNTVIRSMNEGIVSQYVRFGEL